MKAKRSTLIAVPVLAVALTACQSSGHVDAGKSDLHAVASSSAVQQAVQRGKSVATGCVESSKSVGQLKVCLISAVPKDKRGQVKNCLVKDGLADHLTTKSGRQQFEQTSAPLCVGSALPPVATSSPSPSAS